MKTIEGVQVLLSTPMTAGGALDYESTHRLIEHVIRGGVHGIILLGSTGELFSLAEAEREEFGGRDQTILLALANGAAGLTVAGANVVPEAFVRLFELYSSGQKAEARRLYYDKISPMNVIAVPAHTEFIQCYKQALYWMGTITSTYTRGPMMPLDGARKEEMRAALEIMDIACCRRNEPIRTKRPGAGSFAIARLTESITVRR